MTMVETFWVILMCSCALCVAARLPHKFDTLHIHRVPLPGCLQAHADETPRLRTLSNADLIGNGTEEDEYPSICTCDLWSAYSYSRDQVPGYLRVPKLVKYYRPPSCFKCAGVSVLGRHSESVNIWSHIYGWVVMWILAVRFVFSSRRIKLKVQEDVKEATRQDRVPAYAAPPVWPLVTFDVLAGVYFFLSAWAHTFTCMEERYHYFFWMLEKAGIALGILGVHVVTVSYLMYSSVQDKIRRSSSVKSLAVVLVIGTLAVGASWISTDRVRDILQAVMFGLMIGYVIIPVSVVLVAKPCRKEPIYGSTVALYSCCLALIIAGATIFGFRIPERFSEGKYDFVGASHQILHIAIVLSLGFFHLSNARLWSYLAHHSVDEIEKTTYNHQREHVTEAETQRDKPIEGLVPEAAAGRFTVKYGHPPDEESAAVDMRSHRAPFNENDSDDSLSSLSQLVADDRDR